MRAEFCIFESNAPGLKANFYEPYVDMPILNSLKCERSMRNAYASPKTPTFRKSLERDEDKYVILHIQVGCPASHHFHSVVQDFSQ